MPFSVLNNVSGIQAQNELTITQLGLQRTLFRLSSGKRINSGADDAAGLAIADGLRGQIRALDQAVRNANDGVSYLQIADGALAEVTNLLHRAVTLAEEAATSTISGSGVTALNAEYLEIQSEIDRIGTDTTYNGTIIFGATLSVWVGDTTNASTAATIDVAITGLSTTGLGMTGTGFTDNASAQMELTNLQGALNTIASYRGTLGAGINRLQSAMSVISTQTLNLTAAESQIRDANMAQEVASLTKYQILSQAGISALTNSNASAQNVLSLFR